MAVDLPMKRRTLHVYRWLYLWNWIDSLNWAERVAHMMKWGCNVCMLHALHMLSACDEFQNDIDKNKIFLHLHLIIIRSYFNWIYSITRCVLPSASLFASCFVCYFRFGWLTILPQSLQPVWMDLIHVENKYIHLSCSSCRRKMHEMRVQILCTRYYCY